MLESRFHFYPGRARRWREVLRVILFRGWLLVVALALAGCGRDEKVAGPAMSAKKLAPALRVLSGSENKVLEPILAEFTAKTGIPVKPSYQGSVDIMLQLQEGAEAFDAVWPANSVWVELSGNKTVKHSVSIMRSPVVFGIKKSVADRLQLKPGTPLQARTVIEHVRSRKLNFLMSNPTQSNSGAMAYLGFLHALNGRDDAVRSEDLDKPDLREGISTIMSGIDRTSSSSAWLKDLYLGNAMLYNAMVNYEAVIIELNQALEQSRQEPLLVFYPADGQAIADSPLAYLDHKSPETEANFLTLQKYLLSPEVQAKLGILGRRAGLMGTEANATVFRSDWGLEPSRILQPFPLPNAETLRKALGLYQKTFKKPSLTAFVLDFSGSMKGAGERQLQTAMKLLLEEQQAQRYLLSTGEKDVTIVVPFDAAPRQVLEMSGDAPGELDRLLTTILKQPAAGGTNIYAATVKALQRIGKFSNLEDYHVAVILMTDGMSEGSMPGLMEEWTKVQVPVYPIMFGEADPTQLNKIAAQTKARVFDGRVNLVSAFREAKGSN